MADELRVLEVFNLIEVYDLSVDRIGHVQLVLFALENRFLGHYLHINYSIQLREDPLMLNVVYMFVFASDVVLLDLEHPLIDQKNVQFEQLAQHQFVDYFKLSLLVGPLFDKAVHVLYPPHVLKNQRPTQEVYEVPQYQGNIQPNQWAMLNQ